MLRTSFIVGLLLIATLAVAQSCPGSCGTSGGSCGDGCACDYVTANCSAPTPPAPPRCGASCSLFQECVSGGCTCDIWKGVCVVKPPPHYVIILQCPTRQSCFNGTSPCNLNPVEIKTGECNSFNGTRRPAKFSCEGTYVAGQMGTVVVTDCASGNVTRFPNDDCLVQNGGWNNYICSTN
jgi:hypothetical protein